MAGERGIVVQIALVTDNYKIGRACEVFFLNQVEEF